jgi:glycoside/pentoside/hexuronide:cation symporter, GPH family
LSFSDVTYQRARTRVGKVPISTKAFQAVGATTESLKGFAFGTFLLLYYNQILGVNAFKASAAIAVGLIIDAAFDPLIGSFSDGLKTRLGRRHLLMYLSAAPLGLGLYLSFSPPHGLSENLLLAWLFGSVVVTNVSMSLFHVPWTALYAEFSDDYAERTSIVTWRYAVGTILAVAFTLAVYSFIFPKTAAYHFGQLNPHAYKLFAPVVALAVVATILVTTGLTQRDIPYLLQPVNKTPRFSLLRVWRDVASTFTNRNFLILFAGALLFAGIDGTTGTLSIYMSTYFWGLATEQLRWFTLAASGAFAAFAALGVIGRVFDKKLVLLVSFAALCIDGMGVIGLRLLHLLPPNGSTLLLVILVANETLRSFLGVLLGIMFVSMLADTIDMQELNTGRRQEGIFAAALAFSGKATAGVGAIIGGFMLEYMVHWPVHANPRTIDPHIVTRLGLVAGVLVPLLLVLPFALGTRYSITRASHAHIREELDRRRKSAHLKPLDEVPLDLAVALVPPAAETPI